MRASSSLGFALPFVLGWALAQVGGPVPLPGQWTTNGGAHAIEEIGDVVVVGGTFSAVGPVTGKAVAVDLATGALQQAPRINGRVTATVSDGAGGWFAGGAFTFAGGLPRSSLAHILPNGSVDLAWDAALQPAAFQATPYVDALAIANGVLYVGGSFGAAGGLARQSLAAISIATAAPIAAFPDATNRVSSLAVSAATLYVGGVVTLGGQARSGIGAVDLSTNTVLPFAPVVSGGSGGLTTVRTMMVIGSSLYFCGNLSTVNSAQRPGVAAVDGATGANIPWVPWLQGSPVAMARIGTTLYLGGWIPSAAAQPRSNLAAVDTVTAAVLPWAPVADAQIESLAVAGSTVFIGGLFSSISGSSRKGVAAVDGTSGALLSFDARLSVPSIFSLGATGASLLVGGAFTSAGTVPRTNLAAFDRNTGLPLPFSPNVSGTVRALAILGTTVYAAGEFLSVDGAPRSRMAAFDGATGALLGFAPPANGTVRVLVARPEALYAAGDFSTIGTAATGNVAKIDPGSGTALPWAPAVNGSVTSMVVAEDSVYFGGFFNLGGATPQPKAAAVSRWTGALLPWNPAPLPPNTWEAAQVNALAYAAGSVWIGGRFGGIGGQPRTNLARLDAVTAAALPAAPNPDYIVGGMASTGITLFVTGAFTAIGGVPRAGFAQLGAISGIVLPFAPQSLSNTASMLARRDRLWISANIDIGGHTAALGAFASPFIASSTEVAAPCSSGPVSVRLSIPPPVPGTAVPFRVSSGVPGSAGGLFAALPATPPSPTACATWLDPVSLFLVVPFTTDASGTWSIQLPIADVPGLAGAVVHARAAIATPGGSFAGLDLSNVLELRFGL